jgi:hypothetical protein
MPVAEHAGLTVRQVAERYRISRDRVRALIRSGELGAINTAPAKCGKPRFVCLPHHLAEYEASISVGPPPAPARRRKRIGQVDYFPELS